MKLLVIEKIWIAVIIPTLVVHILLAFRHSELMNYWFLGEFIFNSIMWFVCTYIHCKRIISKQSKINNHAKSKM
jgi:hypothetical protein